METVQFRRQSVLERDQIAPFLDQSSIYFCTQMFIGFFCERKIILLPDQEPFGFVGQHIAVIVTPDADNRLCVQISLFNLMGWIVMQ